MHLIHIYEWTLRERNAQILQFIVSISIILSRIQFMIYSSVHMQVLMSVNVLVLHLNVHLVFGPD